MVNRIITTLCCSIIATGLVIGKENINIGGNKKGSTPNQTLAACAPATAQTDLDVNNVRATILAGGDMWWDLSNGQYEIPKGSNKISIFAGSLWIGGVDVGGQLKVAAMTYRQTGNDFWPGPLDTISASTDEEECKEFDKHFKIERSDVESFIGWQNNPDDYPGFTIPQSIINWPAHGDPAKNQSRFLAPFYDVDGDGAYDPVGAGDYPDYDITGGAGCASQLFGDQTLWWVFNDKGDIHTESGAEPIGLEIQAQAFGFATNDEVNNMTFYRYKVINRSSFTVEDNYFGQWVDPDLGTYTDDYVGCDVSRGLGYCYNGDAIDDLPVGYGANPPAVGVDFFQGPVADIGDGIDNDRDGCVDCTIDDIGDTIPETVLREQIIMSKFVYYNNDNSDFGNPSSGTHFYNYLRAIWKDGVPFTYGGTGYGGALLCDFMFPGDSDPIGWGVGGSPSSPNPQPIWDEVTEGNTPADRRFLQSAGPFTLESGAVNFITVGAVWARAQQGGQTASVDLLKEADDKAQALFDNCFQVLNGPDAPDMKVKELNKGIILTISNSELSNNYLERYEELDPLILAADNTYKFQGYQIFQLKNALVSITDIYNPDLARLVVQGDIKDGVGQLVNFEFDGAINANIPQEMVNGADEGLKHSFNITEDKFATGNTALVNFKQYYFTVLAYGYNNYKQYNSNDPLALDGQKKPYKAGRRNIKVYTAIPHNNKPESDGTELNSEYGDGPMIKRIEGQGNGGIALDLTDETVAEILATGKSDNPVYVGGAGPVGVKVIDPLSVPDATFRLTLDGSSGSAKWTLLNETSGEIVNSDTNITVAYEQLIPQWGLSVTIEDQVPPTTDGGYIYLESSMEFEDVTKRWLTGVNDNDGSSFSNWIRSGTLAESNPQLSPFNDILGVDNEGIFENVVGGTWAPYRLCASNTPDFTYGYFDFIAPAWSSFQSLAPLNKLASVDVVITSDKTKWTRAVVLEMQEETALAQGGQRKLGIRAASSIDKAGRQTGDAGYNASEGNMVSSTGMGWFPGYAINLETGDRLNIMYGEDSWMVGENGNDMIWNPSDVAFEFPSTFRWGGKHYVYVVGHHGQLDHDVPAYDKGQHIFNKLSASDSDYWASGGTPGVGDLDKREVLRDVMWVNVPLRTPGSAMLETDVKIRLRVAKTYDKCYSGYSPSQVCATTPANANLPMYTFSTADLYANKNDATVAEEALEMINIVPNPYYAFSAYESGPLDNKVKIINLPQTCTISIYTVNGTLVRTIKKDEAVTFVDWDLKNNVSIPISSGIYIIHVNVPGVGEKIGKFLCVMRPIDIDSY